MRETLLQRLNQIPPFLCRLIARKRRGWAPMSIRDIADVSGLSRNKVERMSARKTWEGIRIEDAEKFSTACGVDLLHPKPSKDWLIHSPLIHVQRARKGQRRMFARLLTA